MPIPEHLRNELVNPEGNEKAGVPPVQQSSFIVGDTVQAADWGNFGKVVRLEEDGSVGVKFVNPETRSTKTKSFTPEQLSKVTSEPVGDANGHASRASNTSGGSLSIDWKAASEIFPRTDFPWDVLPESLAKSLQQLARSCASSPIALPGAAFCIHASTIGRLASICPKDGWNEPLIFWHADIRPSGSGKTPAARELSNVLHERQAREHTRWAREQEEYRKLSKKEQRLSTPPTKERGYFCSDLTLEGLRDDLDGHLTGGLVVIQDELSAFIGAQNQYKSKGTDRESWLSLWDGKPARVVRKERTVFITGARVSVLGGIQPTVFRRVFGDGEDGLYLSDGTVFRFLLTSEGTQFYELTNESWCQEARTDWERLLDRSILWADTLAKVGRSHSMILDSNAQQRFLDWRNDRESLMGDLPAPFRGFLPKAYSYALRLAGVIHCLHRFDTGKEPDSILSIVDIEHGIRAVEFYLAQTVDAFKMLEDEKHAPEVVDKRVDILAMVLESLRSHVDTGRLAVGYFHEKFNERLPDEQRLKTPRACGSLVRSLGLTVSEGKHAANGRSGSRCIVWDEKTDSFIKSRLERLERLKSLSEQESTDRDIKDPTSRMSRSDESDRDVAEMIETSENRYLAPQSVMESGLVDFQDIRDEQIGGMSKQHVSLSGEDPGMTNSQTPGSLSSPIPKSTKDSRVKCADCRHLNGFHCVAVDEKRKPLSWNRQRGQDPQVYHPCSAYELSEQPRDANWEF